MLGLDFSLIHFPQKESERDRVGETYDLPIYIPKWTDGLFLLGPVLLMAATVMLNACEVMLLSM